MTLSMSPVPRKGIQNYKTAHQVFKATCLRYEGVAREKLVRLILQLLRKFDEETSLEDQLLEKQQVTHDLELLNLKIPEQVIAGIIIQALPDTYETLVQILMQLDDSKFDLASVISKVMAEENRRKDKLEEAAMVAKAVNKKRKGKEKDKTGNEKSNNEKREVKKCSHCNRRGHTVTECLFLKPRPDSKEKPKANESAKEAAAEASANVAYADQGHAEPTYTLFTARADQPNHPLVEGCWRAGQVDRQNVWLVDSGASSHMCPTRHAFRTYSTFPNPRKVWLGDCRTIPALGEGMVILESTEKGHSQQTIIQGVLHVPDLDGSLISVSHLTRRKNKVLFEDNDCKILDVSGRKIGSAHLKDGLYILDMKMQLPERLHLSHANPKHAEQPGTLDAAAQVASASSHLWHKRLGHIALPSILNLNKKKLVNDMEIVGESIDESPCKTCLEAKQTRLPIPKETQTRAQQVGEHIFSDVCGPFQVQARGGYQYFATFIDDKSRHVTVKLLRAKSEVA